MATGKEYISYISEQLSGLEGVTCRSMMGEYIVYLHGRIAAYVCDDRFLIKPVPAAKALLPKARLEAPYPGAEEMLLVEETDDREFLQKLLLAAYPELPEPKKKKNRKLL